jgi:hypothetical protein
MIQYFLQDSRMIILVLLLTPVFLSAETYSIVSSNDVIRSAMSSQQHTAVTTASEDTSLGYVVFEMDVETPTSDNQLLGVEFDGTYFYVTGGSGGADPNKVYVIDTSGNVLWDFDQPDSVDYWGWRDLCWDGTYTGPDRIDTLYGSYNLMVHKFGLDFVHNDLELYDSFQGPFHPINRALAYKADSMWFFSADGRDSCYKFSKTNWNIQSVPNIYYMYGAAYDTDVLEGGWVWWHSQDSTTTPFHCLIEQMDAISMNFTGVVIPFVPTIITSGIAGGLCFYEGFRGMDVLFALVQGNPSDIIVGLFVRHHVPGIAEDSACEIADTRGLISCSPNPTRGGCLISYNAPTPDRVSLRIYDKAGCLVKTLVDKGSHNGSNAVNWDGRDNQDRQLPSGVYLLRFENQQYTEIIKIILLP